MGGCRCSYRECPNTTKTENIHFFHYPVKHKERCRIWIECAQKPHFCELEEDQLKNKVICDQHFEEKWFPNPQRKRLLHGAVPTLPGKYVEPYTESYSKEKDNSEMPAFVSHDQDIQVLPANEDGTVFVLDTDAMFTKSQKIESYVYHNGTLVPSSQVSSSPASSQNLKLYSSLKFKENKIKRGIGLLNQNIMDTNNKEPGEILIKDETPDCNETYDSETRTIKDEECYGNVPKRIATEEKVIKNSLRPQRDNMSLDKVYVRKIKQHSRDIASIKKILKEKALSEPKLDIVDVLKVLKDQLPPSLFTIVTLNLKQECELTDDDVDFFTKVHRISPEVYQLLVDEFKWNMPSVDVVDSIE